MVRVGGGGDIHHHHGQERFEHEAGGGEPVCPGGEVRDQVSKGSSYLGD